MLENNSPFRALTLFWLATNLCLVAIWRPAMAQDGPLWFWGSGWPVRHLTSTTQGVLLTGSDQSNFLHALAAGSGRPLWSKDLQAAVWSPPTVVNGTIYLSPHDQTLWALKVETGERLWWLGPRFPSGDGFAGGFTQSDVNRAPPAQAEGQLVTVSLQGVLSLVSLDGRPLARARLPRSADRDQFWGKPAVLSKRALLASTRGRLWTVDLADLRHSDEVSMGPESQQFPSGREVLSGLLAIGERALVTTLGGHLYCYNAQGDRLWMHNLKLTKVPLSPSGRLLFTPVPGPANRLLLASRSRLYCLDTEGTTVWTRPFVQGIESPPAWSPELGVVLTCSDGLLQLDPENGEVRARVSLQDVPTAGPALWGTVAMLGFSDGVRGYRFAPASAQSCESPDRS